jgi:hypothetical protein
MAEHASGQPLACRPVARTLKFPVPGAISMQHLHSLVLSRPASASPLGSRSSGPGPTLAREAASRSRGVSPTTSIWRSLALRLLMFGSRSGGGRGTIRVGLGVGADCVALDVEPLREGLVMFEAARRRSSTTSTTHTTPTTSAVAVTAVATATRVVIPTFVTVPMPRKRQEPR